MKKVWIGLFVVVAAYACGDTAGDLMGGALQDAGTMLQDAGEQMQDGGAQAQESKAVTCDRTYTRTPDGGEPQVTKYALIDVGGKSYPDVSFRVVYKSTYKPIFSCSEGYTCTGVPSGQAVYSRSASTYYDGKAVYQCNGNEESITAYY